MSDKANVRAKSDRDVAISTIEENRRLRAALETFGQHADWCGVWDDGDQPCECGLRDITEWPEGGNPEIGVPYKINAVYEADQLVAEYARLPRPSDERVPESDGHAAHGLSDSPSERKTGNKAGKVA